MAHMDAYVRVSRVGDREGDAYRSPEIQRDEIERWARNNGVEIGKVVLEEDVSGEKAVVSRGLEKLIQRAEAGVSRGVIVHRVDRFSRDHTETILTAKRIKDADARLVGVADGADTDQPHGKWLLNILSMQAEDYLDRVKANWTSATVRAVKDGIHIACKAPLGYLRVDQVDPRYDAKNNLIRDGRLVVDPASAPAIRRAFELRAEGKSYQEVADHLKTALGRKGFAKSSVAAIFQNRAYLGEARGPNGAENKSAHEAIVTETLFAKAQPRRGQYHPRNGSLAKQALLAGLVVCDSCGHNLRTLGSRNGSTGERFASYVCMAKYSGGDCEAPAAARVSLVDAHVAELLHDSWEDIASAALSAEQRYIHARENARKAEEALDAWVDDPSIATSLGKTRFQRGLLARQEALEDAQRALWDAEDPGIPDDAQIVTLDGKPYVYEKWGDDPEADRRHLRRHVTKVKLAKADPKRRKWQPIAERVSVAWRGDE